jgi:hypothetical protein
MEVVAGGGFDDLLLDFAGDVRDDLDGLAEVFAGALIGDYLGVDVALMELRRVSSSSRNRS